MAPLTGDALARRLARRGWRETGRTASHAVLRAPGRPVRRVTLPVRRGALGGRLLELLTASTAAGPLGEPSAGEAEP